MLRRLIPFIIAFSVILAITAGRAHAQSYDDRYKYERWERERWERLHGYGRPYVGSGYYAPPSTFYAPVRPYYAPPPIYQAPSYGLVAPFR